MKSRNKNLSKKKGNFKKRNEFSKRQREIESVDMEKETKLSDKHASQPNDWRWYAANPQLVRDYASFPFGFPVGPMDPNDSIAPGRSTPGSMAFYFTPVFGDLSAAEVAPLNIAMRKFYTFVRHENSGAKNYEAPDLMMMYMAVDSCYTYWSFLKRIAGLLPQYTPYNKYYPRALIEQMGVDFDDLIKNVADFRGFINQFAYRLNSVRIPNVFAYSARHMWMCDGIYTDSMAAKAQTYFYTPSQYWKFNPTLTESKVGGLELLTFVDPAAVNTSKKKLSELITWGDILLNPIVSNEDMNIMSGDILKAYGESGCVHLAPITENYTVLPVYSQEVNSQIENLFIYPKILSGSIQQSTAVGTGYLKYMGSKFVGDVGSLTSALGPTTDYTNNILSLFASWRMLNFHHDGVTPEEVMVATRLMNIPKVITAASTYLLDLTTAGSEVIVGATLSRYTNGMAPLIFDDFSSLYLMRNPGMGDITTMWDFIARLSDFDWAPNIMFYAQDAEGGTAQMNGYTLDVDNYTFLNQENLSKLSEVALLNMLSV